VPCSRLALCLSIAEERDKRLHLGGYCRRGYKDAALVPNEQGNDLTHLAVPEPAPPTIIQSDPGGVESNGNNDDREKLLRGLPTVLVDEDAW